MNGSKQHTFFFLETVLATFLVSFTGASATMLFLTGLLPSGTAFGFAGADTADCA